jgi:hypothetical protein
MTVDEAQRATGMDLPYRPPRDEGPLCGLLELPIADVQPILSSRPPEADLIVEIGVRNPEVHTSQGIHVGSTAAEVLLAYPTAKQENSQYAESLVVYDGQHALVFRFSDLSTDQAIPSSAALTEMSATAADVVTFVELCS